jgi:hypothetical protein
LAAYEKTLTREPRRARSLFGAAQAAALAGAPAVAAERSTQLKELMSNADASRKRLYKLM